MLRLIAIGFAVLAPGMFGLTAGAQDKVSPEEIKAAAALKKAGFKLTVDEKLPDKPVIATDGYRLTIDEKTAPQIMDLKHLKIIAGYDLKFAPGGLKLLKGHPTLEAIAFQGSTDLAALKELPDGPPIKELHLGDGEFTVEHFEAIARVPSIRTVSIYLARIKPDTLRPLHKLKHLEVLIAPQGQPFSAADVSGFDSLVQLRCTAPTNSEPFFEALSKLKTLRKLTLLAELTNGNRPTVAPAGLPKLAALTELTELKLRAPVNDVSVTAISSVKTLTVLSLPTQGLTAAGIKSLAGLPKLTSLGLVGDELPEAAVVELKGLTGLKALYLNAGPLTEEGTKAVGALSNLEELRLPLRKGADKAAPDIAKLTKLRSLDLGLSDLTDTGLKALVPLKELTEIKIGSTKTTPAGQAAFQRALPKVKIITSFFTGFDD